VKETGAMTRIEICIRNAVFSGTCEDQIPAAQPRSSAAASKHRMKELQNLRLILVAVVEPTGAITGRDGRLSNVILR
jgi:hypothetical protein